MIFCLDTRDMLKVSYGMHTEAGTALTNFALIVWKRRERVKRWKYEERKSVVDSWESEETRAHNNGETGLQRLCSHGLAGFRCRISAWRPTGWKDRLNKGHRTPVFVSILTPDLKRGVFACKVHYLMNIDMILVPAGLSGRCFPAWGDMQKSHPLTDPC